ncbi:MAG: hypothetical protein Q8940_18590 [Bacteroidota bacterium]|nr:hypothetical protein [Bacteroidota bacterium]
MANVANKFRVLVVLITLVLMYDITNAQTINTQKDSTETFWHDKVFYKIIYLSDSKYKIEWGNKKETYLSKEVFEVQGNGVFNYLASDKNSIVLWQDCGISCVAYLVLPITFKGKEETYLSGLAVDIKNNLIAYYDVDAEPPIFIKVVNYKTDKKMNIYEKDVCNAAVKAECIDKCYFKDKNLVIKWRGSQHNSVYQLNRKTKKVKIKI